MRKVKRTSSKKTSLEQVLVSHFQIPLKYHSRQALLERIVPCHLTASLTQKSLLLDRFVEMTGYACKSAIRLLNHLLQGTGIIQRSLAPLYGAKVHTAQIELMSQISHDVMRLCGHHKSEIVMQLCAVHARL